MLLHVGNLETVEMCIKYDTVGFIGLILLLKRIRHSKSLRQLVKMLTFCIKGVI